MSHHCHAKGCATACKPEFLMCPRHWRMVPKNTQLGVYRHYRDGQCKDLTPSPEWHAAADVAIAQVARKEGRITPETLDSIIATARTVLNKQTGGGV